MTHREEILWRIAELYTDLTTPGGKTGIRGDGGFTVGLDPTVYTPTVQEYERLVKLMRDDRSEPLVIDKHGAKHSVRSLWWHLEHHWHRAERVIRHDPVTYKRGKHLAQLRNQDGSVVTKPRLDYRRHKDANEAKAELAIAWISARWNLQSEPMIPEPVRSWKGSSVDAGSKVAA